MPRLIVLALASAASFTGPTCAAPPAGEYATTTGSEKIAASISPIRNDLYAVKIETSAPGLKGSGGCGGTISGEARLTATGGILQVANPLFDPSVANPWGFSIPDDAAGAVPNCTVTLKITGGKLAVEEENGCLAFHGASCDFTGELKLKN